MKTLLVEITKNKNEKAVSLKGCAMNDNLMPG